MTTKDEALKQALDALGRVAGDDLQRWKKVADPGSIAWHVLRAIATCREALAQKDEQESAAIGEEWTPCMKLPIVVHCRKQKEGETYVSTREGITPVRHDDLIMRGVAGEEYPIGRELFDKTYTLLGEPT